MKKLFLLGLFTGIFYLSARPQSNILFSEVQTLPEKDRAPLAQAVYQNRGASLDSAIVLPALRALAAWSITQEDELLETTSYILIGEYYKEHHSDKNAFIFLEKALKKAINEKLKSEQAQVYNLMSWLYYHEAKFPQAFEYIIKANNIIENEIGFDKYLYTSRNYYDMGYMYYDFGNMPKAKTYLHKAFQYPFASKLDEIGCCNTLGITYEFLKQYDSATYYFQKTINLAKKINHTAWVGIATGNLGAIYYHQKKYNEAIPYLQIDYNTSIKNNEPVSAGNALCMWADINIMNNDLADAHKQLDSVKKILSGFGNIKLEYSYFLKKAMLYKKEGQFENAYNALDSARALQAKITKRNDGITFSQAEQKVAVEQHLAQINYLQSEKSKSIMARNFLIVVSLLLVVIAAQLVIRQKQNQKRNKELLDNATTQLNNYLESIRDKNLLIEKFKTEIKVLHEAPDQVFTLSKEKEEIADKLKHYTILTDDHWNEFRHLFEKVHNGFFDLLKQKYASLTQSEIRLLALIKLNLSRKEMAEMLGISPDSIKKTRQRIKKKIELPEEMDLEEMIVNIYK